MATITDPQWAEAYFTLIGSIATVLSVVGAVYSYQRNERRKLIDSLRVEAEAIRGLFERMDLILTGHTFMQASDEFRRRLDNMIGTDKSNKKLSDLLLVNEIDVNINRLISKSLNSIPSVAELNRHSQTVRERSVRIGQLYPVTSALLLRLLQITDQMVAIWTGGKIYEGTITKEFLTQRSSEIASSTNPYEVELEDFSSIIDYVPYDFMSTYRQKNIDDAMVILSVVTRAISQSSASTLSRLSRHEKSISAPDNFEYVAESIEYLLKSNRMFFSTADWDRVWEARTRLIDNTMPRVRN